MERMSFAERCKAVKNGFTAKQPMLAKERMYIFKPDGTDIVWEMVHYDRTADTDVADASSDEPRADADASGTTGADVSGTTGAGADGPHPDGSEPCTISALYDCECCTHR